MESTLAPVTADSTSAFSMDRILGLDLETSGNYLRLHRPWTEIGNEMKNRGTGLSCEQQQHFKQLVSHKAMIHWHIGRRPRTAFTNRQVNMLETVFQVNYYPGIQLREELAERLDLYEDRIQIWFQNRRAKLRRSLRETRLQLVQTAVADLGVKQEVIGQLKFEQELTKQLISHLQPEEEGDD